jgi:hypothetical protein
VHCLEDYELCEQFFRLINIMTIALKLGYDLVLPNKMGFADGHVPSGLRKMLQDDVAVHGSGFILIAAGSF